MFKIPDGFEVPKEASSSEGFEAFVKARVTDGQIEIFEFEGFPIEGYESEDEGEEPEASGAPAEKGMPMMVKAFKQASGYKE